MRAAAIAFAGLATVAAVGLSGCVIHDHGPGPGHRRVHHDHHYIYYPSHHAYHCTVHDHWFVREHGDWAQLSIRPPSIELSADVSWVEVEVDGPAPYVKYETHVHDYPDHWKPGRGKGPPPGRGWRK